MVRDRRRIPAGFSVLVPLLWFWISSPLGASLVVPMDDATLVDHTPLIVEGQILDRAPTSSIDHPTAVFHPKTVSHPQTVSHPKTVYTMRVDAVLRGTLEDPSRPDGPALVEFHVPGGRNAEGWVWHVAGAPRFQPGERVLLFLHPRQDGRYALSQLMLGAFRIAESEGSVYAWRDLRGVQTLGPTPQPNGARDLDRFRRWIVDRTRGIHRQPDHWIDPRGLDHPDGGLDDQRSSKFTTIVSSREPLPHGCGANGGHSPRWFDFDDGESVDWRVHFRGQPGLDALALDAFERALQAWSATAEHPVSLRFSGLTAGDGGLVQLDAVNALLFEDPNDEIPGDWVGSGVLAVGGPWFRCELVEHEGVAYHPVVEGDVVTQNGVGAFFETRLDPETSAAELFAHELGHALGFGHSHDPEALMAPELHDDGRGAALAADDLAALDFLYGQRPAAPPLAPDDLEAIAEGPRRVVLRWRDNSDNESSFEIERRRDAEFSTVGLSGPNTEAWVDTGVEPDSTYAYRVRAANGAGVSDASALVEVTTPTDNRPQPPSNLRAAPLASDRIRLTWQDNATDETHLTLEVTSSDPPVFLDQPVQLPANTPRAILSGLGPGSRITARVRAWNSFGPSEPSNLATARSFDLNTPCLVDGETLCLLDGRFRITVRWRAADGTQGRAKVLPNSNSTGFFWFFTPENLEVAVRMVDGRNVNGHFWTFFGGLSDLEYWVTVTDTVSGVTSVFRNPPGELCGRAETSAFPDLGSAPPISAPRTAETPTAGPIAAPWTVAIPSAPQAHVQHSQDQGSCTPDPKTLCLMDGRLAAKVRLRHPDLDDGDDIGQAIVGTPSSGFFWFFDREAIDLVVKVLDGSPVNDHLWLFYGASSDVEYWLEVTDTLTDATRIYYNPPGNLCGRADIEAFLAAPLTGP